MLISLKQQVSSDSLSLSLSLPSLRPSQSSSHHKESAAADAPDPSLAPHRGPAPPPAALSRGLLCHTQQDGRPQPGPRVRANTLSLWRVQGTGLLLFCVVICVQCVLSHTWQECSTVETLDKVVSLLQYMIANPLEIFEVSILVVVLAKLTLLHCLSISLSLCVCVCVCVCQVPHEVQVVAERYCKKRDTTRVGPILTASFALQVLLQNHTLKLSDGHIHTTLCTIGREHSSGHVQYLLPPGVFCRLPHCRCGEGQS